MDADNAITFSNINETMIEQLYNGDWAVDTEKSVEFFKNNYTIIKLVSFDKELDPYLNWLDDGNPFAFDYQWGNKSRNQNENPITLIQLCSSNGVLLIQRNPDITTNNENLLKFITSHQLFTKTTKNDYIKLKQTFGQDASKIQFEDVTRTRLLENGVSGSFDEMVDKFCDNIPAINFDTKRIQRLSWDKNPLKKIQVIFAGFKVAALYQAMKNFPEPNLHYIPEDPNVSIPIQYIQGISRFKILPNLKYMLIYDLKEENPVDLLQIVGRKETFNYIYMFTKDGETTDENGPFDKAIIEVVNLKEFNKKIKKANCKISPIDTSLWEIETKS